MWFTLVQDKKKNAIARFEEKSEHDRIEAPLKNNERQH